MTVCRIIVITVLLQQGITGHTGFKISNEIRYLVTVGKSTVTGSIGVKRVQVRKNGRR